MISSLLLAARDCLAAVLSGLSRFGRRIAFGELAYQLLKQIAPKITRVGIVYNPDECSALLLEALKESAGQIAVGVLDLPIRNEAFHQIIFTAAHRAVMSAIEGLTGCHRQPRYYLVPSGEAVAHALIEHIC